MDPNDTIERWLAKYGKKEIIVNPYEYPDRRMDDLEQPRKTSVVGSRQEPMVRIQTISDEDFKKITGSYPTNEVKLYDETTPPEPKVIRVNSPGMTTQPVLSFAPTDIPKNGLPAVRVIEGGQGIPETHPFVNPWTSTNPLRTSSLLDRNGADPKGHSTTHAYDELRNRMNNMHVELNGETFDILLPADVTDDFSGTKISVGGTPGQLGVKSKENGFYNKKKHNSC